MMSDHAPITLPTPPSGAGKPQLRSILLIDDDMAVRTATAAMLRQWGCEICEADSAETALARLNEPPELIIVDYRLAEGKTALDAIALLYTRLGREVPVIIITGDTDPMRIREAHAAGFMLLHKPLEPERLKLCINTMVEG